MPTLRGRRLRAVAAGLCVAVTACGGGTAPTRPVNPLPTPTPVPAPTTRDGWTEQAVVAEINPPQPALRGPVTARAAGYLTREALFDGTPLFLWPGEESYVRELVYGDEPPWDRLIRWESPIRLTADAELLANGAILAKLQEVAAEGRRVTGLDISVAETGNVQVLIDPDQDNSVAYADLSFRGYTIVGAELVFWKLPEITGGAGSQYRNTLLHEFGHVLGLGHSPEQDDVMVAITGRGSKVGVFSEREAVVFRLMYRHRRSGNGFPDRAPELVGRSRGPARRRIVG